jgi:23S rRNA (guanine2445-N2)-methyltransferase / 23S rRNA (guanine2069-N7)-methyltransferase
MELFATTAKGMEEVLAAELSAILRAGGARIGKPGRAGVPFDGSIEDAYRVCLHSRIANRVLLPIGKFMAPTPEKLYGGVKAIRWGDHLSFRETIAVDFACSHSTITHSQFGAQKTKDAICDQLRSTQGDRPSVDLVAPDIRVNVYLRNDEATVSIDLSGSSLHERGYREEQRLAPLKENLAAAILMLGGYPEVAAARGALVDPMCGSGTLPLEAALIATRTAPGLARRRWGFARWKKHDSKIWERLVREAQSERITDPKLAPRIVGYDRDPRAIRAAIENAQAAGLNGFVHFEKRDLAAATPPPGAETGLFVVNPPYGERLGEEEELVPLYRAIGDVMKKEFKGWKGAVFTGSSVLAKEVGLKADRRHVLFNGPIECRLLTYTLYAGSSKKPAPSEG